MKSEWVAGYFRNRWPDDPGIRNPDEAKKLRQMIVRVLKRGIHSSDTDLIDLRRLREAARKTDQSSVAEKADFEIEQRERARESAMRDAVFREENLAQGRDRLLGQES